MSIVLPLIACVPVAEVARIMPDFLERATKQNGAYTIIQCPLCAREMYLGQRGKKLADAGLADPLCMICAVKQGHTDVTPLSEFKEQP